MEFLVDPSSYEMDSFGAAILEVMRQMADDSRSSLVYLNCGDTHFNAVSSRGSLFQWGKTDLGQLGFYSQGLVPICSVTETLDNGLPSISRIQLGFNHTIAYSADTNRLMAWGDNSKGQHGIGHFSLSSSISDLTHLIKKDCSVSMLECKANSTAVVLSDGSAYLWPYTAQDGSVSSTPMYAAFGKLKILSVSLGLDFSMFLISDGTLYSMGSSNKYGELGVGDTKPRFTPVKLKSLFDSGHL
jgi:alpha-tubulin suppressor-like RCC1 family protein